MRSFVLVALLGLCLAACGERELRGPAQGTVTLPAPATALVLGDGSDQGLDTLWATHAGGLSTVTPRIEGGAALTHTLALPGAEPVAVTTYGTSTFILDRASEAVLVFEGDTQRAALKVGSRPSALVVDDFNDDDQPDIAVANEGSDDVSILVAGPEKTYLPERRIAVGARPRALVEDDFDHLSGLDLAVANAGSSTVSVLLGDWKGGFTRAQDLQVGQEPTAFLATDVDGDQIEDLVVADSGDGTLAVLLGTARLLRPGPRVTLPGGAASRPVDLTAWYLPGEDAGLDLFVAAQGSDALLSLHLTAGGAFQPANTVLAIAQPVAVQIGLFAGDRHRDLAVASATGSIAFVKSPGARVIAPDLNALTVAASKGTVVWSRRLGPHRYGLATVNGPLAVPVSRADPRPRIGRAKSGGPVLTHLNCGRRRCRALASDLDGRHERAMHDPRPERLPPARLRGVARTGRLRAPTRSARCTVHTRGLWLRDGRTRRVSRFADRLGDLRDGRLELVRDALRRQRLAVAHRSSARPRDHREQRQPRLLSARGRRDRRRLDLLEREPGHDPRLARPRAHQWTPPLRVPRARRRLPVGQLRRRRLHAGLRRRLRRVRDRRHGLAPLLRVPHRTGGAPGRDVYFSLTVALTALALFTRTLTVAVLPARTTYFFVASLVLPRSTSTVPRHTAPASPLQFTRTADRALATHAQRLGGLELRARA